MQQDQTIQNYNLSVYKLFSVRLEPRQNLKKEAKNKVRGLVPKVKARQYRHTLPSYLHTLFSLVLNPE
jgi:hypothetical protein